ncbi:MAG: sulfatase-like hydrolase/transferase [Pirellulales bacterium]|nr:sulfatase-like hydrolase/transferase [Pirellulales bacterium]
MNQRTPFALITCATLLLAPLPALQADESQPTKPNIVFILADDLGLDGVGCYGSDRFQGKTPNLDRLAETGVRFTQCYSTPLCGPSRCLIQTGRYGFRTGGLTNQSANQPSFSNEPSVARTLKQAGYATGMAGKWRQMGDTPGDWGFDEWLTDPTGGGWYWKTSYIKNGQLMETEREVYCPDICLDFAVDFFKRHREQAFYFYYPTHLVHGPILRTPDSESDTKDFYDDNVAYLDKQVGQIVAELDTLGLREKTLIVFTCDNGTAKFGADQSFINGRKINGQKGTMLEGGSRVPLIANWEGTMPEGRVLKDLVDFSDFFATFAELAGAKMPEGITFDSRSFASQLLGKKGTPREWIYVQLGARWYLRDQGFKLTQSGELFDMSDAPFVEALIDPAADSNESNAARQRLAAALAELNPAGGKTDQGVGGRRVRNRADLSGSTRAVGPWKSGDFLPTKRAPNIARKALEITAELEPAGTNGVVLSQGGAANGYALYLTDGKLAFAVRQDGNLTTITAKNPLGSGHFSVQATLGQDGTMALLVDGEQVAEGKAAGLIPQQPKVGFSVGTAGRGAVGDFVTPNPFQGKVTNVHVKTTADHEVTGEKNGET